jgi:hypothetical protein
MPNIGELITHIISRLLATEVAEQVAAGINAERGDLS